MAVQTQLMSEGMPRSGSAIMRFDTVFEEEFDSQLMRAYERL